MAAVIWRACLDKAGDEMVRVSVRILLLLAVIAAGRAVISEFFQPEENKKVVVVVVPGGECPIGESGVTDSREG